ncbi:hypothetical protein GCM10027284_20170 [Cyclobacterium sediminis]
MPLIEIETYIQADIEIVFDLSRSVDLHKISTEHTNEKAISGRTRGLMELNESVTWKAKHFGVYQVLTSKISDFERPNYFLDYQEKGIFKYFKHHHYFDQTSTETKMVDKFDYESPFGILGNLADRLLIKKYMTNFLIKRNSVIKEFAESDK